MPFPTTGILDNFTRANEGPPPSARWDYHIGGAWAASVGGRVVTNRFGTAINGFTDAYWKTPFGPDCEVYYTVETFTTQVDRDTFHVLRMTQVGTSGSAPTTEDGYCMGFVNRAVTDEVQYQRVDNGVLTQLGALEAMGTNIAAGHKLGVSAIGSTLQAWHDTGAGFVAVGSRTDATYGAAGVIGGGAGGPDIFWDDFGGGTVRRLTTDPSAFPIQKLRESHTVRMS